MGNSDALTLIESLRQRPSAPPWNVSLMEESPPQSGIAIHDRDLRCIAWSNLCEQLSDLPSAAALHSHCTLDTPLLQLLGGKRALESALAGGTLTLADILVNRPGQPPRWIACTHTPLFGAEGGIAGVISQLADVSVRIKTLNEMEGALEEYRDLYHNSPSGHHSFDKNGVFTQMNNTELRWLGYHREEVVGRLRLTDILTLESAKSCVENLQKLRALGSLEEIEYDIVRKDGSVFPAVMSGKAKYGADSEFMGGRITVVNTSERRRIETALRYSEENLRRAQTLVRCGNYQFSTSPNADNQSFQWSDEMYQILGRNPQDGPIATQFYVDHIVHPDDRNDVVEAVFYALEQGTRFDLEYRIVRPDGSIRHVRDLGELETKTDDGTGHFFGVIQDVTDLRQAQDAINKRERLFASLVENSYDGVALFDANGRVSYISPVVSRILGYTPAEFAGVSFFGYIHPDDVGRVRQWSRELRHNPGKRVTDEFRFQTKSDGWLWMAVTQSNQLQNKAVGAFVCNFRDISERKARDAELKATNQQLLEMSRQLRSNIEMERTRIARELHDELGATLTAIKMYIGTPDGTSTAQKDKGTRRALELIDTANEAVARIVTNLRPSLLDHRGLYPAIQWLMNDFEERTGIVCEFTVAVDRSATQRSENENTALFRICQEALNNISRHANASIASISINGDSKTLRVEIRDNGIGLDPNVPAASDSWGIIGMRERVHELGGEFAIKSAPNQGTCVTIEVPWYGSSPRL